MKRKEKTILCILMATVFLMPLMGNTVLSESRSGVTYYFNSYDASEAWERYPEKMVDGNENNYSSTTIDGDVQLCDDNSYDGDPPFIPPRRVEIRAKGYTSGTNAVPDKIILTPVFGGTTDGLDYEFILNSTQQYSQWFDITYDPYAPYPWTWSDIDNLDIDVKADFSSTDGAIY